MSNDDFCLLHGYEHMERRHGDPIAHCSACADREMFIRNVLRDVAELPDRTSPEDQPDMMLVTGAELRAILERHS